MFRRPSSAETTVVEEKEPAPYLPTAEFPPPLSQTTPHLPLYQPQNLPPPLPN